METGYRVLLFLYIVMVFAPHNVRAMNPIFSVDSKECHCTLLKKTDENFYVRIQRMDGKSLFTLPSTSSLLYPIVSIFFPGESTFILDSSLMAQYMETIKELAIKNAFTESPVVQQIQTNLEIFIKSIKNIFQPLIPFPNEDEEFVRLFGSVILSTLNNARKVDERLLSRESIEIQMKNITKQIRTCLKDSLVKSYQFSEKYQKILNKNIGFIENFFEGLLLGNYNYKTNLAEDSIISRPFRLVYYEIQKLGLALNVAVEPIDPLVTNTKNALAARARSIMYNKYTILGLLGTAGLGLATLAKWGRPTINWSAVSAVPGGQ
jgi:hypothetical protein